MDDSNIVTFKHRNVSEITEDENSASGGDAQSLDRIQASMEKFMHDMNERMMQNFESMNRQVEKEMTEMRDMIGEKLERESRRKEIDQNEKENSMQNQDENESESEQDREHDLLIAPGIHFPNENQADRHVRFQNVLPSSFPLNSTPIRDTQNGLGGIGNVPTPSNEQVMFSKQKPQKFDGSDDLAEYLTQYELVAEANGWNYKTKSLCLASSLIGNARGILNELSPEKRRDYDSIVKALENRFGSVNRAEIFRSQLQSKVKSKDETIPQLAQNVKRLTRKAYPKASEETVDILALDHFIDALPDADIRLRIREVGPKTITDAESMAVRLEAHRVADKTRGRQPVKSLEVGKPNEEVSLEKINETLSEISKEVKDLQRQKSDNNVRHNHERLKQNQGQRNYDHNRGRNFQMRQNENRGFPAQHWPQGQGQFQQNRVQNQNFRPRIQGQFYHNRGQGQVHNNLQRGNAPQENMQRSNLGTAARQQ